MALIAEIHQPKIAMVPIGDRFTMSPAIAALAVKRFLQARHGDPVPLRLVPDHRGEP
jgi:L-ascorbate metabolism protein UlaG (beta-lactamase superfamily)